jgi:N-acetylmuramoyl-L-alanine amidase
MINSELLKKVILAAACLLVSMAIGYFTLNYWQLQKQKTVNIVNETSDASLPQEEMQNDQSVNSESAAGDPVRTEEAAPAQKKPAAEIVTENKAADNASSLKIADRLVSWGYTAKDSRAIDTIIIHSNYNTLSDDPYSISGSIQQFKTYGVAAHYLIGRDGTIYRLVAEKNVAYHAGVSSVPDGRKNVNDFSIGIELMTKDQNDSPTASQYAALKKLVTDIKSRYSIKYVLGHKDIAPGRKTDPWGFNMNLIK